MRVVLLLSLLATSAFAWPVDVYVDVKTGEEKFQKAAGAQWVEVQGASVAAVEVLPGDEILVTGKGGGEALALIYGEGRMGVWSVGVDTKRSSAHVTPPAACPGARVNPASLTDRLVVNVKTEECRKALLFLFESDKFHSREITLTFDIPVMQSQLREIQAAIDTAIGAKKVEALYAGGSLRLKGNVTMAEHKKVLWAAFEHSVGRISLDDRLILTDKPASDAGTAK